MFTVPQVIGLSTLASDHMKPHLSNLESPVPVTRNTHINLPTVSTVKITHTGAIIILNSLSLNDVLCVPNFKQNLLYVQKLIKRSNCEVKFFPSQCIILDCASQKVIAVGEAKHGMYYLVDTYDSTKWSSNLKNAHACLLSNNVSANIWHHRLGHMPISKLCLILDISKPNSTDLLCVTCPIAKFTKLLFGDLL